MHFQSEQTMVLKILNHEIVLCFLTVLLIFITLNIFIILQFLKKIKYKFNNIPFYIVYLLAILKDVNIVRDFL